MKCKECQEDTKQRIILCPKCYAKDWRKKNPNKIRAYLEKNKDRIKLQTNKNNDLKLFGGKRFIVLERDNWECQECGMTQEQNIVLFGRSLSIHHIDGNGRGSKNPNNDLNNLVTLCFKCHPLADRGDIVFPKTNNG